MWGLKPIFFYCQTLAGLSMWGALSEERTGLSFASVTAVISLLSVCTIYILHVIKCLYIQYIQDLYQSRLSTTDHDLLLVTRATTAV
jgi:hypothetical protein